MFVNALALMFGKVPFNTTLTLYNHYWGQ
jgi:hypothetical protein